MYFDVSADAYARFMGRFSEPLADLFVDLLDPQPGQRAIDVGCGPGALTERLVGRLGAGAVSAVDPSASFVAAAAARFPDVEVRVGTAEHLDYADGTFDVAAAQLVVHFMSDPVAGLHEMARVTRSDGTVGACVWDHGGESGPLSLFWAAASELDPHQTGEALLPGSREGELIGLFEEAGLVEPQSTVLTVVLRFATFEEWWEPFTLGVGPAGAYVRNLSPDQVEALRGRCAERLPPAPFEVAASAWAVSAHADTPRS